MSAKQADDHAKRVRWERERLRKLLPDVDPEDLDLILDRMLRAWGTGQRLFIRPRKEGGFEF